MLAIDTNVLVRLIVNDDPVQAGIARKNVAAGAWVSHLVLAEAVWVLTTFHAQSRGDVVKAIELLLSHPDVAMQDLDVVQAALSHFRQMSKVSFSDCLILEIARKAGHMPLGTFDRDFAKLDGAEKLDAPSS